MNGKNGWFVCPAFSFCNILRPFAKGCEGNIVEFTVLLACYTTGAPGSNVLSFLFNGPSWL
ncbi:hypothetical protein MY092_000745 [Salmonella enterica]|nr:hypothetical protein [Salmonella enterica]